MADFWRDIKDVFEQFQPLDALDILIIAFIIYWIFLLLRGTVAVALLRGAAITLVGAVILARALDLEVLNFVIRNSVAGLIIAGAVIFHPEIRRALERVGRTGLNVLGRSEDGMVDLVISAMVQLARRRHGALVVFERETGLQNFIESGITVDATPSVELLTGIFFPNTPLHDGAAIIRDNRVVAAGCALPLSDTDLPSEMGLRHRAGLSVTEGTDAVSIMVSEETGTISVAAAGRLYTRLDEARLRGLLGRLLGPEDRRNGASAP